ncbi:MAG TPA: peptide chain release factor N(5)-glutamine methyltransferase [Bacillota bacterium]
MRAEGLSVGSTVREALAWGTERLQGAGVPNPQYDTAVILGQIFGRPRLELPLYYRSPLTRPQAADFEGLVRRRMSREPLQYVLGHEGFMGLDFSVDPRGLIPRPETEGLAERALAIVGAGHPQPRIADVGTGSGCLAIVLAKTVPGARVWAIDRSEDALALARENAAHHVVADQIEFVAGDYLQPLVRRGVAVDLVVSNPPYIPSGEIPSLQEEVREFEPRSALDGGPDGLAAYRALAGQAPLVLTRPGWLALEIGHGQAEAVAALLAAAGFGTIENHSDLAGISRVITARIGLESAPPSGTRRADNPAGRP